MTWIVDSNKQKKELLHICKHECNGPSRPPSRSKIVQKNVVASIHDL
jgi:hypothetical protein